MKVMRHVPNCITAFRLVGALVLCFLVPLSAPFFILYTMCGISDVLDGFLARTFHVTSSRGAWLDSIADLIFYGVMLIKNFDILLEVCPIYIWHIVNAIFTVRVLTYLIVAIKYHHFAAIHTYANKACGVGVFLIPYVVQQDFRMIFFHVALAVACFAAVEELLIHIFRKEYDPNVKTIFVLKRAIRETESEMATES